MFFLSQQCPVVRMRIARLYSITYDEYISRPMTSRDALSNSMWKFKFKCGRFYFYFYFLLGPIKMRLA